MICFSVVLSITVYIPRHNLVELEKKTYFYIGAIIALSLIHGGPGPQFFSSAVADYIVYGVQNVNAGIMDVLELEMRDKIKVCLLQHAWFIIIFLHPLHACL